MNHGWDLGKLPPSVGLPREYFVKRGIFLDCRGPLAIHKASVWGFGVVVLTQSHNIKSGKVGAVVPYGVTIDAGAWIGSCALLAGCHIGAGAVVAAGTVVRGQDVAPRVMVAGNPARVIARWNGQQWQYLPDAGYSRRLE